MIIAFFLVFSCLLSVAVAFLTGAKSVFSCLQVQRVQEEAAGLVAAYAGDKQADIRDREQEVVDAWKNLQGAVDSRKNNLLDASDLYRFFAMVLDLTLWMSDILLQMKTVDKARWILFAHLGCIRNL